MKNLIIYGAIFLLAFAIVTGALFFLNTQYKNIFAFDFSPETHLPAKVAKKPIDVAKVDSVRTDSTAVLKDSVAIAQDSTAITQSVAKATEEVAKEVAKTNIAEAKPTQQKKAETQTVTENPMVPKTNSKLTAKKDSIYNDWVKQTVKLYEAMDSKKVAKVILGYSDNIARDLILRMRKKKAAEILAEFKPEVVTRLISVN
ncbi:MAG: hypothetical protein Q8L04_15725 [Ignavibacteria bacterium]|nr:hypothetical protein [Ignavibacteria bacterium]